MTFAPNALPGVIRTRLAIAVSLLAPLLAMTPAAPASAADLLQVYRDAQANDAQFASARSQLLASINSSLTRARQPERRRMHVLTGPAGAGKTLVALEIARRAQRRARTVWWVRANRLEAGMRQVALELGAPVSQVTQAWSGWASASDLVWRLLNDAGAPWLLVFDDVANPRELGGHGTGWLRVPATAKGIVLVTTRDSDSSFWRDWATVHTVSPLSS